MTQKFYPLNRVKWFGQQLELQGEREAKAKKTQREFRWKIERKFAPIRSKDREFVSKGPLFVIKGRGSSTDQRAEQLGPRKSSRGRRSLARRRQPERAHQGRFERPPSCHKKPTLGVHSSVVASRRWHKSHSFTVINASVEFVSLLSSESSPRFLLCLSRKKNTVLHEAVLLGSDAGKVIKLFLEYGANPAWKNARNETVSVLLTIKGTNRFFTDFWSLNFHF